MRRFIMAHPRSAQNYISRVIYKTGLSMGVGYKSSDGKTFYKDNPPVKDGIVSFYHKGTMDGDVVLHQVRDPLKVISSARTETQATFNAMFKVIGDIPRKDKFYEKDGILFSPALTMWTWLHLNEAIEKLAQWRYRIEDIDKVYPELCEKLKAKPLDKVPDVPRNFNTRKPKHPFFKQGYSTWEELEEIDKELYDRIREKGKKYGYT